MTDLAAVEAGVGLAEADEPAVARLDHSSGLALAGCEGSFGGVAGFVTACFYREVGGYNEAICFESR